MPEIKSHGYLLQYLQDIGYYQSLGMGMSPISYTEIKAYVDLMKLDLSSWEIQTIKSMSVAYVSAYNDNYSDTEPSYKPSGYSEPLMSDDNVLKAFGIFTPK